MEKEKELIIKNLLISAGETIVEIYNSGNFKSEIKSDNTPVTIADKTSSKIINSGLQELFPGIAVIDEENKIPEHHLRKDWTQFFLLDPLDGTKEFIKQNGEFCINLALFKNNKLVEGWIYQPLENKGWHCVSGNGICEFNKNGNARIVKEQNTRSETLRIVTSRSFFKPKEKKIIDKIKQVYNVEVMHKGSSLKQISMVLGNADMYLKAGPCSEWDTAPGQLMIEEFGGAALQLTGFEPMNYNKQSLLNPHFVMLNKRLNNPEFIIFLKNIISSL